ncbi:MAG: SusE domain-containing protein [Bacteroidota bacterium]
MKVKLNIFIVLIGLMGILSGCEKDGTKIKMLTDPIAPVLTTLPNLTLERANGLNVLEFNGVPVDPGFNASANYFLEACASGNNFVDAVTIFSGVQVSKMEITVSDLNSLLLKKFPAEQATSVDFRVRAVLVVDAGTGALGTSSDPLEYISEIKTSQVVLYGLPRLNLIGSGMDQKIESALGNGVYKGYVKLDPSQLFTLENPDTGDEYGASGSTLVLDGAGIQAPGLGWFILTADLNALSYATEAYMIGLIGSATPTSWDSDTDMDYNPQTGTWSITIDLVVGEIKFRKNDGWAWNLGGTTDNLTQGGANLPIPEAGNYTITLTIINDATGTCTIVKN